MRLSELDYDLPPEQIAQQPLPVRDQARLYVLSRSGAESSHRHRSVADLPELLPPNALLVVNDTRVIPARLRAQKPTGGQVELLLVEPVALPNELPATVPPKKMRWRCLGRASKPIRPGPLTLTGAGAPQATVVAVDGEYVTVDFADDEERFFATLERVGEVPLPPYIRRPQAELANGAERRELDRERYQTVFAAARGAVAAPTAGLHFTPALLQALLGRGIERVSITLHVGPGTFAPARTDEADAVVLHPERFVVSAAAAATLNAARRAGRPIVAVGTTVVRTLETVAAADGTIRPQTGHTQLCIRPGHRFRAVDQLITNFHLPRSTLLMLVAALAGKERVLAAYAEAVALGYRFYSYGDAMLIQ